MPGVEAEQGGVEPEAGGPRLLGLGVHGDQGAGQDGGVWCCDAAALLYTVYWPHMSQHSAAPVPGSAGEPQQHRPAAVSFAT